MKHACTEYIIIGSKTVQTALNYEMSRVLIVKNSVHILFLYPCKTECRNLLKQILFQSVAMFSMSFGSMTFCISYFTVKVTSAHMDRMYVTSALLSGQA